MNRKQRLKQRRRARKATNDYFLSGMQPWQKVIFQEMANGKRRTIKALFHFPQHERNPNR